MKIIAALIIAIYSSEFNSVAQSQWKFHIAFEDASGAKDTIWCIWDSTAHLTTPVDTALGEGPVTLNNNDFNVFVYNYNGDTTKTVAMPISGIAIGCEVRAINFQYPLNVYWDQTLFNAIFLWPYSTIDEARIDNDYFFSVNNDPPLQAFNMLFDDHAYAPEFTWFSQSQFPMHFNIARHDTSYLNINPTRESKFLIYPNPIINEFHLITSEEIQSIKIIGADGINYSIPECATDFKERDYHCLIQNLKPGFYVINIITIQNITFHEKIIKTN